MVPIIIKHSIHKRFKSIAKARPDFAFRGLGPRSAKIAQVPGPSMIMSSGKSLPMMPKFFMSLK